MKLILILFSILRLGVPSGFYKKYMCTSLITHLCYMHSLLIGLYLIILIIFGESFKLYEAPLYAVSFQPSILSSLLGSITLLSTLFSNTISQCPSPNVKVQVSHWHRAFHLHTLFLWWYEWEWPETREPGTWESQGFELYGRKSILGKERCSDTFLIYLIVPSIWSSLTCRHQPMSWRTLCINQPREFYRWVAKHTQTVSRRLLKSPSLPLLARPSRRETPIASQNAQSEKQSIAASCFQASIGCFTNVN
jgi:hypothetical protein